MESLKREIPFLKMREAGVKPEKPREPPVKTKVNTLYENFLWKILADDYCEKWADEKSSWTWVSFSANLHSRRIRWSSSWNYAKASQGNASWLPSDS